MSCDIKPWPTCFVTACFLLFMGVATPQEPTKTPTQDLIDLQRLSQKDLFEAYEKAEDSSLRFLGKLDKETVLTEMVRRGDAAYEQYMGKLMDQREKDLKAHRDKREEKAKSQPPKTDAEFLHDFFHKGGMEDALQEISLSRNLELLTALRRIQKKHDPLTIKVTPVRHVGPTKIEQLWEYHVVLKNVDVEKKQVFFTDGGDYRTGRLARWRFEVRDSRGKVLPQLHAPGRLGGGLTGYRYLKHGETWETALCLMDYVDLKELGEYTVRILYHNEIAIADLQDVTGLIVSVSEPFTIKLPR
jgi:hypothetical protein